MEPYYDDGRGIVIYHGDCRDVLPTLDRARLVVTDPPYAFGLASTAQEGKAGSWADVMNNAYWYATWLRECHRLTVGSGGATWVFSSWRTFPVLARAAYEVGWPIESLMVWDKEWIGPGGHRGLRPSYELVALFAQSAFSLADRGLPDIWRCKWSSIKPNGHPAEKPVTLIARIIKESGGGLTVDPFCGSGTTLCAAKSLGFPAVGIEAEERYCEIAARRLSQEVFALDA